MLLLLRMKIDLKSLLLLITHQNTIFSAYPRKSVQPSLIYNTRHTFTANEHSMESIGAGQTTILTAQEMGEGTTLFNTLRQKQVTNRYQ